MVQEKNNLQLQDLLDYARESQEVGGKFKVSGDQHVMHLLASVAREAEESFAEKGLAMVERAVARFGEERGRRIAQLVKKDRKPLTLMNFFLYSDLDISGNEMVPEFVEGELRIRMMKCRLFDKLREFDLQEYAKHYCRPIDLAVLHGYNPRLELDVKTRISEGADCCLFVYRQPKGSVKEA